MHVRGASTWQQLRAARAAWPFCTHNDVPCLCCLQLQSNAAVGVKAAEVAGGCACCAVRGELEHALAELVSTSSYASLDALVGVRRLLCHRHACSLLCSAMLRYVCADGMLRT